MYVTVVSGVLNEGSEAAGSEGRVRVLIAATAREGESSIFGLLSTNGSGSEGELGLLIAAPVTEGSGSIFGLLLSTLTGAESVDSPYPLDALETSVPFAAWSCTFSDSNKDGANAIPLFTNVPCAATKGPCVATTPEIDAASSLFKGLSSTLQGIETAGDVYKKYVSQLLC